MDTATLLYLFSVLGSLRAFCIAALVIASLGLTTMLIVAFLVSLEGDSMYSSRKFCKVLKCFAIAFAISGLGVIAVPSTSECYVIYGVGTTIDYLKNNETASQLPDKAVKALDAWLEYQTEQDKDDNK